MPNFISNQSINKWLTTGILIRLGLIVVGLVYHFLPFDIPGSLDEAGITMVIQLLAMQIAVIKNPNIQVPIWKHILNFLVIIYVLSPLDFFPLFEIDDAVLVLASSLWSGGLFDRQKSEEQEQSGGDKNKTRVVEVEAK